MKVLNGKSFKLPFIERDKFVSLVRVGLGYNKGFYFVKDYNNIEKVIDIISDILGEKTSFLQVCVLCGKDFSCSDCKHYDLCTTRDLPLQCFCEICRATPSLYDSYVNAHGSI